MKLLGIAVSILLFGLFVYLILISINNFQIENGASNPILGNSKYSNYVISLEGNLTEGKDNINDGEDSFSNSSITLTSSIPYVDSVGGIWKTVTKTPKAIYSLTMDTIFGDLFGDSSGAVVTGILTAIFILTIIFAVWLWISTGQGGN